MNNKKIDEEHTRANDGQNSFVSSSSDGNTSSPATTTSLDSTSSGSESTIIEEIVYNTTTKHKHMDLKRAAKMDTDRGISGSGTSSTPTITSTESVRHYKNSPFGLSNHYLTMPDPNQVPDTFDITATESKKNQKKSSRDWKKKRQQLGQMRASPSPSTETTKKHREIINSHNNGPSYRDLSLIVPVSTASQLSPLSSPNWPSDNHHHPQHHHHHHLHEMNHSNQLNNDINVIPAFDAGLDAKKCNSKQLGVNSADDYFCNIQPQQQLQLQLQHQQQHLNTHHDTNSGAHTIQKKIEEEKSSSHQSYDCLLVRFSSIMYATFLVILGCILHCSELRQKSKNSSDHIYTIIVALIGIAWLLFLQGDLQRYKRYASKYIMIESIFNDHKQKMREMSQIITSGDLGPPPSGARSTSSSSASLVNDRMSMNTEVIFKKTAYRMYQRRAAALNNQLRPATSSVGKFTPINPQDYTSPNLQPYLKRSRYSETTADSNEKTKSDLEEALDAKGAEYLVPAYKFLHGKMGANFYLKCGMAAFCFGHVIHEGLHFGQQLYFFGTGNVDCRDSAALIAHLITPLYSFYQLFMMFKYSNLVINRHKVLAKFGLMHIVGTSITFWIRTILEEAYEDFVHKMDYFKSNKLMSSSNNISNLIIDSSLSSSVSVLNSLSNGILSEATNEQTSLMLPEQSNVTTVAQSIWALMSSPISATITPQIARHLPESYACAQNTLLTTKSMNALPYLYPFTIEYNLLLAATFLSLYFNIGKIGSPHGTGGCRQPFTAHSDELKKRTRRHQGGSSYSNSPTSHQDSSDNMSTLKTSSRKDLGEYKSNFVVNADCHSANKGLFCGFFVLLVTLVTIVIFFVTINKPSHVQLGIKINLIQEGVLTTLILVVMIIGFKQVSKLNRSPYARDKFTTDDVLMLIPLPFFFFHSLLSFRAETAYLYRNDFSSNMMLSKQFGNEPVKIDGMRVSSGNRMVNVTNLRTGSQINRHLRSQRNMSNGQLIENFINDTSIRTDTSGDDHNNNNNSNNNRKGRGSSNIDAGNDSSQIDHFKLINVALNIVVMIEVLVQTNFIIDGMRRCSESRYLRFKKPGRELITFAILLNITYWIVATFETKSVEQYKPEIEYYGPLPYMFISHTTLPVMLFYRYHSSVCLAEIWNRAYKPPKRR